MPWVPYRGFELDTSGGSVRFVHLKQHKPELYSNCDAECYSGSAKGREQWNARSLVERVVGALEMRRMVDRGRIKPVTLALQVDGFGHWMGT